VGEAAGRLGVELRQPERIRDEGFLEWVQELRPDACVVVAYGKILPTSLLEIPPRGFLNVHASLLPRYRGAAPIQRAIENGDTATGVTIMQLDAELDHGPVYDAVEIPIGPDERTPELATRLAAAGGPLLVSVLDRLERGALDAKEQDHALATRAGKIQKSEGRVTWDEAASGLYDRFRAFWPWPGLFTDLGGETIKLLDIRPAEGEGDAGSILELGDRDVVVATREGATRILEIQRPGGRPMAPADLARSRGLKPGARFE